jgi:hypothetical protein
MNRVVRILALTLAAVILACGDSSNPSNQGSFTASITGDLTSSLTGRAVFGVGTQGSNQGFVIALERQGSSQIDRDVIVVGRLNTQRPGEGTYPIVSCAGGACGNDDFDAGYVFYRTSGESGLFLSESGTLTITESSAEQIVGTMTFDAPSALSMDQITITASFTAVPGTLPSVP